MSLADFVLILLCVFIASFAFVGGYVAAAASDND